MEPAAGNGAGTGHANSGIGADVRTVKTITGFALLGAGIAMLALPGPGALTIAAGLAMLATEFDWARRLLNQGKDAVQRVRRHIRD